MRDPVVEAARRARYPLPRYGQIIDQGPMEDAAREALKPIRELHEKLTSRAQMHDRAGSVDYADGIRRVLAELAPLIYITEELEK